MFLYIAVVIIGPRVMASRKAFELKPLLMVYNLALTGLSAYMMVEVGCL